MNDISISFSRIIIFIVLILITTAIYYLIAKAESNGKAQKTSEKNHNLIWIAIGLFVGITLGLFLFRKYLIGDTSGLGEWELENLIEESGKTLLIVVLIIRVIMLYVVGTIANRQNRNMYLWGALAFIEFHAALIALGLNKVNYSIASKGFEKYKFLKNELESKITSLKKLAKIDNKTANNLSHQIQKLNREFDANLDDLLTQSRKEDKIEKLEQALNAGAISQNEFEERVKFIRESKSYF